MVGCFDGLGKLEVNVREPPRRLSQQRTGVPAFKEMAREVLLVQQPVLPTTEDRCLAVKGCNPYALASVINRRFEYGLVMFRS